MEEQQCIFCMIANGQIPAKKVYEDSDVLAVLDINPGAPGHILLLPKKHVMIMPQLDVELAGHIGMIAKQLSGVLIRVLQVEGVSIFAANGGIAGQRAPHFMMHVIPRFKDDNISLNLPAKKLNEKDMKLVFEKLASSVKKVFGVELGESTKEEKIESKQEEASKKNEKKDESSKDKEAPKEVQSEAKTKKEQKEERKEEQPIVKISKSSLDDITEFLAK